MCQVVAGALDKIERFLIMSYVSIVGDRRGASCWLGGLRLEIAYPIAIVCRQDTRLSSQRGTPVSCCTRHIVWKTKCRTHRVCSEVQSISTNDFASVAKPSHTLHHIPCIARAILLPQYHHGLLVLRSSTHILWTGKLYFIRALCHIVGRRTLSESLHSGHHLQLPWRSSTRQAK